MTPDVMPIDAEAGLVEIHHGGALQKLSGVVHKRGELLIEPLAGIEDRPLAHNRSEEIGADLTHPAQRDPLILVEIGEIAQKSQSVLGGRHDVRGSRRNRAGVICPCIPNPQRNDQLPPCSHTSHDAQHLWYIRADGPCAGLHMLDFPFSLVPGPRDARRSVPRLAARPERPRMGEGMLSQSLQTRHLPATPGPIGYNQGNGWFSSLTRNSQRKTIIDTPFVSHADPHAGWCGRGGQLPYPD